MHFFTTSVVSEVKIHSIPAFFPIRVALFVFERVFYICFMSDIFHMCVCVCVWAFVCFE